VIGVWAYLASIVGCSSLAPPDVGELVVNPDPIRFGEIAAGEAASTTLTLRSNARSPVVIERIDVSCPCIRVAPGSLRIDPGGSAALRVSFDPTKDPNYRGELGVHVIGFGDGGRVVFRTRVELVINPLPPRAESANDGLAGKHT
jgi:hypothetical protein